jgi:hypothetical protein
MKQESFSYTYSQDRDCGADLHLPEDNILDISTCNNGIDNYLVIETERWAIDEESLEQLYATLKELLRKA